MASGHSSEAPDRRSPQTAAQGKNESTPMLSKSRTIATTTLTGISTPNNLSEDVKYVSISSRNSAESSGFLERTMKTMSCLGILGERSLRVDFLAMLFGIGSWIGVNSVYLQLPLFVAHAPEGWSLPSYLVIVIQIANIGPLIYTLIQKWSPRKINDSHMIYVVYVIGFVAAICMATLYKHTAFVAGEERSVALLAIAFLFAFIGCTSSVLFMPYMGRFKEIYLITYLVGEGLSGFLPSLLTLAQGVGGNTECVDDPDNPGQKMQYTPPPRFMSDVFFGFIVFLIAMSGIAFVLLDTLKFCRREYAPVTIRHGNNYNYNEEDVKKNVEGNDTEDATKSESMSLSVVQYTFLMLVMAVVSMFGSGVFPSIQSYSCLPYGSMAYHLTVTLSSIANPLACFMAVFLPHKSIRHIVILTIVMTVITVYALTTAGMSPNPPLRDTTIGSVIVIICWTVLTGLVSYIKLSVTAIFRYQGGQSLVWIGAVSQAGSAIGALISFCLVNIANLFVSYQECS